MANEKIVIPPYLAMRIENLSSNKKKIRIFSDNNDPEINITSGIDEINFDEYLADFKSKNKDISRVNVSIHTGSASILNPFHFCIIKDGNKNFLQAGVDPYQMQTNTISINLAAVELKINLAEQNKNPDIEIEIGGVQKMIIILLH